MQGSNSFMYYFSAGIAILGTIGYHNLVKKIPPTIDPMISIISIYLGVLLLGLILIPFIYSGGKIMASVHQLGWVQLGIAVCILVMELGFILMYRNGWDLSVGNVVTGVFINLALLAVGVAILHERLYLVNMLGVVVCILGVSMIEYHGDHAIMKKIDQIIPSIRNIQFGRIKDESTMAMTQEMGTPYPDSKESAKAGMI